MFLHLDGDMRVFAKNKIQWTEDLYFTVNVGWLKLSKYSAEVTPTMGLLLITAHIPDLGKKLQLFRKWNKAMDTHPEEETSYTTQYTEAFVEYVMTK